MSELKIECPSCGQHVLAGAEHFGKRVQCPGCHGEIQIPGPPAFVDEAGTSETPPVGMFAYIEELLWKMLRGVFKFVFQILPPALWRLFSSTFPWLARVLRIAFLLGLWLALVFWPYLLFENNALHLSWLADLQNSKFILSHQSLVHTISFVWGVLAIIGSVWGVLYLRWRTGKRRERPAA